MAASGFDKKGDSGRYMAYCERLDRWIPWKAHRRICAEVVEAKKGSLHHSYCEHFCECWGHLMNDPEVRCICYGFDEDCKKIGLW